MMGTDRRIDLLKSLLASGETADLAATVRAVDEFRADERPLDERAIRELLLVVSDEYSHVEVLGSVLGRLEVEGEWASALLHSAAGLTRMAPEIFESYVARALNGLSSRAQLLALVTSETGDDVDSLLRVAKELAKNPRPRPGDSARIFLAQIDDRRAGSTWRVEPEGAAGAEAAEVRSMNSCLSSVPSSEALEALRSVGWFDRLPPSLAAAVTERILAIPLFELDRLASVVLDVADFGGPEDYAMAFDQLEQQMVGVVAIHRESALSNRGAIVVSFTVDERQFSTTLVPQDDWMSFELVDAVNQALNDCGRSFGLRSLPVPDNRAHFALTSEAAFERAVSAGLIPDALPG